MARTIRTATPERVRERLRRLEELYAMPSEDFLRRWHAGALDDCADYFKWAGVCHLAVELGLLSPA